MSTSHTHDIYLHNLQNQQAHVEIYDETQETYFHDDSDDSAGYRINYRTTSLHRNRIYDYEHIHRKPATWAQTAASLRKRPSKDPVNMIVRGLEEDRVLNGDTSQAEKLRKEALRDLPQGLTMKRNVKSKLEQNLEQGKGKGNIGCFRKLQYDLAMFSSKLQIGFVNFLYSIQLWYGTLKSIEEKFGSAVSTYFIFYRQIFFINCLTLFVIFGFIVLPQIIHGNSSMQNLDNFQLTDIFTGGGSFNNSILYYGYYTNGTLSILNGAYDMSYAYFFVMLCTYFTVFVIISYSMARSFRKSHIETKGGLKNVFANKILCGWDFSIANEEAAKLKSTSIYREIKELLQSTVPKKKKSCMDKLTTLIIQVAMNLSYLLVLVGIVYGLWILLKTKLLGGVITAVVINIIISLLPLIYGFLTKYEDYSNPQVAFYFNYVRNFFLELAIIGILIGFWVTNENIDCWETNLGQEIYRLVIFDFIFSLILLALTEIARSFIYKNWEGIGEPEFNIPRYSLQLTYNQTLFWVGLYFAPLLSAVVVIKLFVMWYLITTVVKRFCIPPKKTWSLRSQTLFFIRSFISLILVIGALGYIVASIKTSNECGPFRQYEYVYNIVKDGIIKLKNGHLFWKIILYIFKPGVVTLVLIGMFMGVYYLREKEKVQNDIINKLQNKLRSEARERQAIYQKISSKDYKKLNPVQGKNRDCGETYSDVDMLLPSYSNNSFSY